MACGPFRRDRADRPARHRPAGVVVAGPPLSWRRRRAVQHRERRLFGPEDPDGRGEAAHRPGGGEARSRRRLPVHQRSEEHTSELQSLMRISYAVFCLKKKNKYHAYINEINTNNSKIFM